MGQTWQTSTVWFSPVHVRISHRHHRGRVLLYFTHSYCFPKTTTWWQAGETTNPSSFCPQTDCLEIKITTGDTVHKNGVAKLSSWVCPLRHFTVNFFSLFSFDQAPRSSIQWRRAVSSKQCGSELNAWLHRSGVRGLCSCMSLCVTGISSPHWKYLTCLVWKLWKTTSGEMCRLQLHTAR